MTDNYAVVPPERMAALVLDPARQHGGRTTERFVEYAVQASYTYLLEVMEENGIVFAVKTE